MHLLRIVVLVADSIVQRDLSQIVLYKIKGDHNVVVQ